MGRGAEEAAEGRRWDGRRPGAVPAETTSLWRTRSENQRNLVCTHSDEAVGTELHIQENIWLQETEKKQEVPDFTRETDSSVIYKLLCYL